jgi:hypothetical protein
LQAKVANRMCVLANFCSVAVLMPRRIAW